LAHNCLKGNFKDNRGKVLSVILDYNREQWPQLIALDVPTGR